MHESADNVGDVWHANYTGLLLTSLDMQTDHPSLPAPLVTTCTLTSSCGLSNSSSATVAAVAVLLSLAVAADAGDMMSRAVSKTRHETGASPSKSDT